LHFMRCNLMFFILLWRVGRAHYIRSKRGRGRGLPGGLQAGAVPRSIAGGRGDLLQTVRRSAAGRMICRRSGFLRSGFLRSVLRSGFLVGGRSDLPADGLRVDPICRGWSDLLQADGRRATAGGSVRSSRGAFLQADGRRATAGGRRGRRRCAASSVASCSLQAWQVRPGRIVAGGRRQRQRRRWLRRDFRRVAARRINSA